MCSLYHVPGNMLGDICAQQKADFDVAVIPIQVSILVQTIKQKTSGIHT